MNKEIYFSSFKELHDNVIQISEKDLAYVDQSVVLVIASNEELVVKKLMDFRNNNIKKTKFIFVAQPRIEKVLDDIKLEDDMVVPWIGNYNIDLIDFLEHENLINIINTIVFFCIQSIDLRDVNILTIAAELQMRRKISVYGIDRDFDVFSYRSCKKILEVYSWFVKECNKIDVLFSKE